MSTVPEVLVARAAGVPVLGLSVITNAGAGMRSEPLSHDEVVRMGAAVREDLGRVLDGVVRTLGDADP
jgi:purine-nucleoside phosphorylase